MDRIWEQFNISLNNLVDKLQGWLNALVINLPDILLASLVLLFGIFLTRRMRKYFERLIGKFSNQITVTRLLANMATSVFFLIILFVVLSILGLDTALTTLLGTAGVAGLAVGLALQDPIVNLFSGIMMSARSFFKIGDLVETNGFFGVIQKISLRSTILRTQDGQEVVLPNKSVYQNALMNYSTSGERRIVLGCGISYGDDLVKVREVTTEAVRSKVNFNKQKPLEFFFTEFGSSSINFIVRFWIDSGQQGDYLRAQSEAIVAVKQAFDANGITIPFPIRTLDFGIKGGRQLHEMLPEEWVMRQEREQT